MLKTAAVTGVPNRAANRALIPAMVMICRSFSSSRTKRPRAVPMLPPICSAAPSRPAEPPHRWVRTVPMKISGVIFRGISFCVRIELSTRFVPSSWAMPHSRYRATMTSPASGSK